MARARKDVVFYRSEMLLLTYILLFILGLLFGVRSLFEIPNLLLRRLGYYFAGVSMGVSFVMIMLRLKNYRCIDE